MIAELRAVALDCPDPRALAEFYAAVTGGRVMVDPEDSDWVEVRDHKGTVLACQKAEGHVPPRWPDPAHSQQLHLDFRVDSFEEAEPQVLALGATLLERTDEKRPDANWRVYADPAGHPFCLVVAPH